MRLELTNTELNAFIKGGVPGKEIAEARRISLDTVREKTMALAAPTPRPPTRTPAPKQVKVAAAKPRGLFARLLDALFGVSCWPLVTAIILCGATEVVAQSDSTIAVPDTTVEEVSTTPDPSGQGDDAFFSWIVELTITADGADDARDQHDGADALAAIGTVESTSSLAGESPNPSPTGETAPIERQSAHHDEGVESSSDALEAATQPHSGLDLSSSIETTERDAWLTSGLAVLIIGALTFLIWQLRGIELRMNRLERRSSWQQSGRLDICITDARVEATTTESEPDAARSLHDDPSADSLPPIMTTAAVVFEDGSAWRTGMATRTGPRDDNQDAVKVVTVVTDAGGEYRFFDVAIIADGLGGEPGGRRAAILATEWAASSVVAQIDSGVGSFESIAECAVRAASNAIQRDAEQIGVQNGLRTTLAVAVVSRESGQGAVASIGDSESFIRRSDGSVKQCVRPQKGMAAHQVAACLGPEQLGNHQVVEVNLECGDMLILTTDGVVQPDEGRLTPEEAAHAVVFNVAVRNCSFSEAALGVIDDNLDRGGADVFGHSVFTDNQTIAIIGTGRPPTTIEVPASCCLSV